jgi:hypothetical protein
VLLVALALLVTSAPTAQADGGAPACPAAVGDLPLSVAVPFSGTLRPTAGSDGEIASTSLLCAYGEGVAPSAEVQVTWQAGSSCGRTTVEAAAGVDRAPFDALADDLAAAVGGACPPEEGASFPIVPVAAGAGGVLLVVGVVAVRRARRRQPTVAPPDLTPVLRQLRTGPGRALARSEEGQWLVVAAVAQARGRPEAAELARQASRPGRRSARPELAGLAHQVAGGDR